MCKRRKKGDKNKEKQKRKGRPKKKRTCCQKCKRKIRNWFCKKIKRCIKKTVFGDPDPQLDDFEIAGINLGNVRDNLQRNKTEKSLTKHKENIVEKKPTVITLFRKNQGVVIKNAILNEYDRYSINQSIGKKVKSFIDDFKERNLFLEVSKDSKLDLDKEERERLRHLAKINENKSLLLRSFENLKNRFPLTVSKSIVFRNMVDDFKKGRFSLTDLSNKLGADVNNINSKNFNKLLDQYKIMKERKGFFVKKSIGRSMTKKVTSKYKNISKNLELLKNMSKHELKKEFSLSDSKQKILGRMITDYKAGKVSLSRLSRDLKNDLKVINKENLNKVLDKYQRKQRDHYPIVKQSKLKQLKSDLRAKIGFL